MAATEHQRLTKWRGNRKMHIHEYKQPYAEAKDHKSGQLKCFIVLAPPTA